MLNVLFSRTRMIFFSSIFASTQISDKNPMEKLPVEVSVGRRFCSLNWSLCFRRFSSFSWRIWPSAIGNVCAWPAARSTPASRHCRRILDCIRCFSPRNPRRAAPCSRSLPPSKASTIYCCPISIQANFVYWLKPRNAFVCFYKKYAACLSSIPRHWSMRASSSISSIFVHRWRNSIWATTISSFSRTISRWTLASSHRSSVWI